MLHNRHDLNGVVPQLSDSGQDFFGKLAVGTHTRLFLRHADMALVDVQGLFRDKSLIAPDKGLRGIVDDGAPAGGYRVLNDPRGVQRDAVQLLTVVNHNGHHPLSVL